MSAPRLEKLLLLLQARAAPFHLERYSSIVETFLIIEYKLYYDDMDIESRRLCQKLGEQRVVRPFHTPTSLVGLLFNK